MRHNGKEAANREKKVLPDPKELIGRRMPDPNVRVDKDRDNARVDKGKDNARVARANAKVGRVNDRADRVREKDNHRLNKVRDREKNSPVANRTATGRRADRRNNHDRP